MEVIPPQPLLPLYILYYQFIVPQQCLSFQEFKQEVKNTNPQICFFYLHIIPLRAILKLWLFILLRCMWRVFVDGSENLKWKPSLCPSQQARLKISLHSASITLSFSRNNKCYDTVFKS